MVTENKLRKRERRRWKPEMMDKGQTLVLMRAEDRLECRINRGG